MGSISFFYYRYVKEWCCCRFTYKKPLAGISVIRVTNSYTSNLEGSYRSEPMRIGTAVTDSNGRFSFSSFIKLKPWFKKADQLYVNASRASADHLSIKYLKSWLFY